jgi:hypothetical protein
MGKADPPHPPTPPDETGEERVDAEPEPATGELLPPRPPRAKTPPQNRDYPGAELLRGESPRQILRRIHEGDPLGLAPRCFDRLQGRAILLVGDRLLARALVRVALQAPGYDGVPPLDRWLEQCIDWAIDDLLGENADAEHRGDPPTETGDPNFAFLSETLGVEPPLARKAAIVFNDLPPAIRRTFWEVVVKGKTTSRWVAEGHGPPEYVKEQLAYALGMVSSLGDADLDCPAGPDVARGGGPR